MSRVAALQKFARAAQLQAQAASLLAEATSELSGESSLDDEPVAPPQAAPLQPIDADAIAERLAERIRPARIADVYTSSKVGPNIPGKSRDWMLRHIGEIPGAHKVGRDWIVTRVDYERWLTAKDTARFRTTPVRKAPAPARAESAEDRRRRLVEEMFAREGLRPTKAG